MTEAEAPKVETIAAEIEGRKYPMLRRIVGNSASYSFDGGEEWEATAGGAFASAKKRGKLPKVEQEGATPEEGIPGETAAAIVELLARVRALRPGESLRVVHAGTSIQVLAEKAVLALRPSDLEGIGIEPAEDDGPPAIGG